MKGYKLNVTMRLAKALTEIGMAQCDDSDVRAIDAMLEELDRDIEALRRAYTKSPTLEPIGPDNAPHVEQFHWYTDHNMQSHKLPNGVVGRLAMVSNSVWCVGYDKNGPRYEHVPNQSGSEFVDIFIEFRGTEADHREASAVLEQIEGDQHIKTQNIFFVEEDGQQHQVSWFRFMSTHRNWYAKHYDSRKPVPVAV